MIGIISTKPQDFDSLDGLKDYVATQGKSEFIDAKIGDISINDTGLKVGRKYFGLKECGLKSMCSRIKMPVEYAKRIPTDLFINSANRLIKEQPNQIVTVNTTGGDVRAIHSGMYLPITNQQVLDNFNPPADSKVRRINISDEYMSIAMSGEESSIKAGVGDIVEGGAEINNSETGFSTFAVRQYLYRLVCSNGATMAEAQNSMKKIHLGYQDFDVTPYLESATKFITDGTQQYQEAFKKMKDDKLTNAVLRKIEDDIKLSLGKLDTKELVESWTTNKSSAYTIFNDVTKVAHTRNLPFAKQQNLEMAGGKLLTQYL